MILIVAHRRPNRETGLRSFQQPSPFNSNTDPSPHKTPAALRIRSPLSRSAEARILSHLSSS